MARRKTPARSKSGRFKKGASSTTTTRRKRRTSTTASASRKKTSARRRRSSGTRKLTVKSFVKDILMGLKRDWIVYALAVFLMAVGYAARPTKTKTNAAGQRTQDWTAWLLSIGLGVGGAFFIGKFAPKKLISSDQARKAAVLAAIGLTFYAAIQPLLMRTPGLKQIAETGEKLGAKLNKSGKTQTAASAAQPAANVAVMATPPFDPNFQSGVAGARQPGLAYMQGGVGNGAFYEQLLGIPIRA